MVENVFGDDINDKMNYNKKNKIFWYKKNNYNVYKN